MKQRLCQVSSGCLQPILKSDLWSNICRGNVSKSIKKENSTFFIPAQPQGRMLRPLCLVHSPKARRCFLVLTLLAGIGARSPLWKCALIMNILLFLQHHLLQKQRVPEVLLWKKEYQPSREAILKEMEAIFLTLERSRNLRGALTFRPLCILAQRAPRSLLQSDNWHLWTFSWSAVPSAGHYASNWGWAYHMK